MGQAKRRGTFEQRKSAAIQRNELMRKQGEQILRPRNLIRPRPSGEAPPLEKERRKLYE